MYDTESKAITIWTLNQTTHLLREHEGDRDGGPMAAIVQLFAEKDIQVHLGNRDDFDQKNVDTGLSKKDSEDYWACNLMHEVGRAYDEYFVPIPFKCIGRMFEQSGENPELEKISEYYSKAKGFESYKHFWDSGSQPGHYPEEFRTRMLTEKYVGYYEILCKTAEKNKCKNILIGYSQGGVVARYLAYLDEYVFKRNVIHGVITVAAPNHGSPVANPDNRENVVAQLQAILLEILPERRPRKLVLEHLVPFLRPGLDFDGFIKAFDDFVEEAFRRDDDRPEFKGSVQRGITSLRKWVGGLEADPHSAFIDLDAKRLDDPGSVLHSVHANPPKKIYHGHILTASNSMGKFLEGLIPKQILDRVASRVLRFLRLHRRLVRASRMYRENVLIEVNRQALPDAIQSRIDAYHGIARGSPQSGLEDLKPFAHDFLVPTAYQYVPGDDHYALGSAVSKFADHNSGREPGEKGGKENIRLIMRYLERMRDGML